MYNGLFPARVLLAEVSHDEAICLVVRDPSASRENGLRLSVSGKDRKKGARAWKALGKIHFAD